MKSLTVTIHLRRHHRNKLVFLNRGVPFIIEVIITDKDCMSVFPVGTSRSVTCLNRGVAKKRSYCINYKE